MAVELVQVQMTKSVDFANRGELIWLEPEHGRALARMGMARVVQEKLTEGVADGSGGEGDAEPAAGNRRSRKGEREGGAEGS